MNEFHKTRLAGLNECIAGMLRYEIEFLNTLNGYAKKQPNRWVTEAQSNYLVKLCWKYRAQLERNGFKHVIPAQSPFETDNKFTTADASRRGAEAAEKE
jgi:hypothetical protein